MSLPLPPTDNLYKFLAVTGLLMILAPQILFWSWDWEYWQKNFEITPTLEILERETGNLKEEWARLKTEIARAEAKKETVARLVEKDKQYGAQTEAYRAKYVELKAKHDFLKVLTERLRFIARLAWIGGIAGPCSRLSSGVGTGKSRSIRTER